MSVFDQKQKQQLMEQSGTAQQPPPQPANLTDRVFRLEDSKTFMESKLDEIIKDIWQRLENLELKIG